jgi:hypothetical protein
LHHHALLAQNIFLATLQQCSEMDESCYGVCMGELKKFIEIIDVFCDNPVGVEINQFFLEEQEGGEWP